MRAEQLGPFPRHRFGAWPWQGWGGVGVGKDEVCVEGGEGKTEGKTEGRSREFALGQYLLMQRWVHARHAQSMPLS